jgi:hypothetical protein
MIAEIVSNGMLSLPGALAVVGVSESVPLPRNVPAERCTCLMRVPL